MKNIMIGIGTIGMMLAELAGASEIYKPELTAQAEKEFVKLADNPQLKFFAETRKEKRQDRLYPKYHFLAPENSIGDPNGLCYWRGNWHIFYQFRPIKTPGAESTGDRQTVYWGHAVSSDLIHWQDLPIALYPRVGKDCFSGGALVEKDRVLLSYHATGKGNQIVEASDPLLLDWRLIGNNVPEKATIPAVPKNAMGDPYRVWDPCIFKRGTTYYSISGMWRGSNLQADKMKRVAIWHLFSSENAQEWTFAGNMLENDPFTQLGDDGSCSYLWPLGTDKDMLMFYSHRSGTQFMVGTFEEQTGKFTPEWHRMMNSGPASAAPLPGEEGRVIVVSYEGGAFTLPRTYGLDEKGLLSIEPAGDTDSLRGEEMTTSRTLPLRLPPGEEVVLGEINGNAVELMVEIDPGGSSIVELNVLRSPDAKEFTTIRLSRGGILYNPPGGQWSLNIDTAYSSRNAQIAHKFTEFLHSDSEPFRIRVFIDRSLVEVFVNDAAHQAQRTYPMLPESTGVSIRSTGSGAVLKSVQAWEMGAAY